MVVIFWWIVYVKIIVLPIFIAEIQYDITIITKGDNIESDFVDPELGRGFTWRFLWDLLFYREEMQVAQVDTFEDVKKLKNILPQKTFFTKFTALMRRYSNGEPEIDCIRGFGIEVQNMLTDLSTMKNINSDFIRTIKIFELGLGTDKDKVNFVKKHDSMISLKARKRLKYQKDIHEYFDQPPGYGNLDMTYYMHGDRVFETTFSDIFKFYSGVLAQLNSTFMVQKCKSDPQHEKEYEYNEIKEALNGKIFWEHAFDFLGRIKCWLRICRIL